MMKKEQSSIEWLTNNIKMLGEACYSTSEAIDILYHEAKELHKKEIIEAFHNGQLSMIEVATEYYTEKYQK